MYHTLKSYYIVMIQLLHGYMWNFLQKIMKMVSMR